MWPYYGQKHTATTCKQHHFADRVFCLNDYLLLYTYMAKGILPPKLTVLTRNGGVWLSIRPQVLSPKSLS